MKYTGTAGWIESSCAMISSQSEIRPSWQLEHWFLSWKTTILGVDKISACRDKTDRSISLPYIRCNCWVLLILPHEMIDNAIPKSMKCFIEITRILRIR